MHVHLLNDLAALVATLLSLLDFALVLALGWLFALRGFFPGRVCATDEPLS